MYALKDKNSSTKRFLQRWFQVFFQLVFVLAVWEFLKSSTKSTVEDTMSPRRWRAVNPSDCFRVYSQSDTLQLNSIMSRTTSEGHATDMTLALSVDIIVHNVGSDSLTVYPAGTTVLIGNDTTTRYEQVLSMDYFEYNDNEIPSNVINNDFVNKEHGQDAAHEHVNAHNQEVESGNTIKGNHISRQANSTQKTASSKPTENRVLDVMLIEDEMLRVQPKDQLEQQEIMQLIRKNRADRFLLRKRARLLNIENTQTSRSLSWFEKYNSVPKSQQHNTEAHLNEKQQGKIEQNCTKDVPLAWPEVVLDEASEPLYTEGFLERVQTAKSQLYSQPTLYDQKLKERVRKYYILNNARACIGGKKVDIVYLIHSQPWRQQHRQLIRETIVKSSIFGPFNIVYVFLLGKTRISQIQEDLRHESKLYGDIVQGDFDDQVDTNVWKGLMGMRWVLQHCRNVRFVLKINEDVFVDSEKLLRGFIPMSINSIGKRAVFCSLRQHQFNTTSNLTVTTPYCDGFAVLMTRHLVCSIVAASHQIRVPPIEDYYLYGILPYVIGGVQVYNVSGDLGFQKDPVRSLGCFQEQPDRCSVVITQSGFRGFMQLWNQIGSRHWRPESWSGLWDLQSVGRYFS